MPSSSLPIFIQSPGFLSVGDGHLGELRTRSVKAEQLIIEAIAEQEGQLR